MAEIDDVIRNLIKTNDSIITKLKNIEGQIEKIERFLHRKKCLECDGTGVRTAHDGYGIIDEWSYSECNGTGYEIEKEE